MLSLIFEFKYRYQYWFQIMCIGASLVCIFTDLIESTESVGKLQAKIVKPNAQDHYGVTVD